MTAARVVPWASKSISTVIRCGAAKPTNATGPTAAVAVPRSAEEVAAVVAVLSAAARSERLRSADDRPLAGGWKSYYRTLRPPLASGRDAWRTYHRL